MSEKKGTITWKAAALARLSRVPEGFMRDLSRQTVEGHVRSQGGDTVTLALIEEGLSMARQSMESEMMDSADSKESSQPLMPTKEIVEPLPWSEDAQNLLDAIPVGMSREMTRNAANTIGAKQGISQVDGPFLQGILDIFRGGAAAVEAELVWDEDAQARLARIPETVRGMLIQEIEGCAKRANASTVDMAIVENVFTAWGGSKRFHLNPNDPRH